VSAEIGGSVAVIDVAQHARDPGRGGAELKLAAHQRRRNGRLGHPELQPCAAASGSLPCTSRRKPSGADTGR
jgi:hypothetical protein